MLKINYEFRKGIFFLRLMGDLNKETSPSKELEINNLIFLNEFKYIVINTNFLKSIDLYGLNYLNNLSSSIKNNKCNLIICDKFNIIKRLLIESIPNIKSELEVL